MCGGGGGKSPKIQAAPTAPTIVAPIEADTSARNAGELERKRRKAASGRSDTILTTSRGDTSSAKIGSHKLLGE